PFYAWRGEARTDPVALARLLRDSAPLLRAIRAAELEPDPAPSRLEASDPRFARTAWTVVHSEGLYYGVGASTVSRESETAARRPGPAVVVISGRRMEDFLELLNQELEVKNAAIAPIAPQGANAMPVVEINGHPIGAIAWTSAQPGGATLRDATPVFMVVLVIL